MNTISRFCITFVLCLTTSAAIAGYSEDELKLEISFLAQKLLKMSGESEITVSQPSSDKPFLGICPKYVAQGIKLTCITPGQNAEAAGLKTGDIITAIDSVSTVNIKEKAKHDAYHKIVDNWQSGDEFTFTVLRNSKTMTIDVTVGSMKHPAYTITISEK